MTQFNLADELRRRGTEYACLGCCRQFAEGDESMFPEWQHERCGGLVRKFASPFAAAVPAGNQAKAPTALDELLILTARQRDDAWDALTESREALARVEAERDELKRQLKAEGDAKMFCLGEVTKWQSEALKMKREHAARIEEREELRRKLAGLDGIVVTLREANNDSASWERMLYAAEAELRKRDAVIEAARYVVRLHHHPSGQQAAENAFASLMFRLDELEDQAASEAEVAERAIVVGSEWMFNGCLNGNPTPGMRRVHWVDGDNVHAVYTDDDRSGTQWSRADFFNLHTWVSDPEVTESAPREG